MEQIINNKRIFIEEEHHHVLQHWIRYHIETSTSPILITLDHHTDTITAFHGYACKEMRNCESRIIEFRECAFVNANIHNIDFINNLRNDEHIDFATRKDIISKVYISSFQGGYDGERDSHNEKVYHINSFCHSQCEKKTHDDDCMNTCYDRCIESDELANQLSHILEMNMDNCTIDNYILDIDLDFFHTVRAITPDDASIFHRLIRGATIITIATEPNYVNQLKRDEQISTEYLLRSLLRHIEQATSES